MRVCMLAYMWVYGKRRTLCEKTIHCSPKIGPPPYLVHHCLFLHHTQLHHLHLGSLVGKKTRVKNLTRLKKIQLHTWRHLYPESRTEYTDGILVSTDFSSWESENYWRFMIGICAKTFHLCLQVTTVYWTRIPFSPTMRGTDIIGWNLRWNLSNSRALMECVKSEHVRALI